MSIAVEPRFVGIDVGKFELVFAALGEDRTLTFANTPEGIEALTAWLLRGDRPVRIALEATGGHEWPLWEALDAAGLAVRQVAPAQVRAFARSRGARAKSDRIDAHVLAAFSAFRPEAGRTLGTAISRQLKALVTSRRQRVKLRMRLQSQMQRPDTPELAALDRPLLAMLTEQIADLDRRIAATMQADDASRRAATLLRSIPGIGPVLAATLLAEMPELGTLSAKAAAALTGVAPIARDSGTRKGMRFISGGRKPVRDVLFMAATTAAMHNPDLGAFFRRLRQRGLPHKKAAIAVARKLIILANAVLKRRTPWRPNTA